MLSGGPSKDASDADAPNLFGALQGCFTSAVLIVDQEGQIIMSTPAAETALGLKPGKTKLPAALQQLVRDCLAQQEAIPARQLSGSKKKGPGLSASASPIRRGRTTDVAIVLHDLAPWENVEDQIHRITRLADIGTLSASAAHEIKNALVAVKTFLELLLEKNRDAELTEVVQREMLRIEGLVGQMLRFARPPRPVFAEVRLHDVLDHSLRMVQHQLDGKLISLNRSFQATPDCVEGDDSQLEQAFVNLFINALEAMGPNGSLKVATELVADGAADPAIKRGGTTQLRVTISDTGIGVKPENLAHMFEPFFTTKQNGTGLGLPITRRIFREHHGDISVKSELNHGTTFSVFLPAQLKNS